MPICFSQCGASPGLTSQWSSITTQQVNDKNVLGDYLKIKIREDGNGDIF